MLWFDPALPEEANALEFLVHYRERLHVRITPELLRVSTIASDLAPVSVGFRDEVVEPGTTTEWSLTTAAARD